MPFKQFSVDSRNFHRLIAKKVNPDPLLIFDRNMFPDALQPPCAEQEFGLKFLKRAWVKLSVRPI
jgi:hypothetical protein